MLTLSFQSTSEGFDVGCCAMKKARIDITGINDSKKS